VKLRSKLPAILVFPFNLLSHYSRSLQLCAVVQDKFNIRFPSSSIYNELIEKHRFSTFDCESFDSGTVLEAAKKFNFSWLSLDKIEKFFLSQVAAIKNHSPVCVIGDTAPTLKMAAEYSNTRYFSIMNGYMTKYYKTGRKIPNAHPLYNLFRFVPNKPQQMIVGLGEQIKFWRIHKPFSELRKKYGLIEKRTYLDELEGDYNFICDPDEFFPQKELPENYYFIGPLYYFGTDDERDLLKILPKNKKNIVIHLGSSGNWESLKFLADPVFNQYNFIIAGDLPFAFNQKNIITRKFINMSAILDKVDLVICHGGNGTIYQSLAHGVPLLCLTNIFEQEWNVQQLEKFELGRSINNIKDRKQLKSLMDKWIKFKGTDRFKKVRELINIDESMKNFRSLLLQLN
jgi:UDP:flavonoid glycosyltransferase YjiC (YdhE family)